MLRGRKVHLTLAEIVSRAEGDGGLGPVLFVLALPLLMVALQIVAGRRRLWLPDVLARRSVERGELVKLMSRLLPLLNRLETMVRPRWRVLTGVVGVRVVGVACSVFAMLLILPIPFANLVPSLGLGIFALGLARMDGLLVLAGYGLLALTTAGIVLGLHGIVFGLGHLRAMF
ncbi:exopolysaccharide biosynthesis protein [Phenylobacterium sp.]|uniref:exopolysaccharide biosynthesis protein n=1 Tax=Phenylobacterium sp. TaxID=1871053 RepID=UPI0012234CDF|nr:exopolysaccharide biosynthesis protein [Phenylobacterium sp.]THD63442.1 MAG: exopolysaccharide biosynthesis protein [Phenylobacterium sp.]